MLPAEHILALAIFCAYFALIILLFILVLRSIELHGPRRKGRQAVVYGSLAVLSLAHTWYYMIKFLIWSKREFESRGSTGAQSSSLARLADWLVHTRLFEQAWFAVCDGPWNWLWSEQLCLFTAGAWTVFLYVESRRSRVALPWAYMLLGQLVAISVASNLFYLALAVSPRIAGRDRAHMRVRVPAFLWMCVAAALASVYTSPALLHSHFLSNLLVMHGAITLPLLPLPKALRTTGMLPASVVYWLIACAALLIRMGTLRNVFFASASAAPLSRIPHDAWSSLHSHPAQSSIGWDIVWTTLSFAAYELLEWGASWTALFAPVISVGVVAPCTLAAGEPRLPHSARDKTA